MQYDNPARRLYDIICNALKASTALGSPDSINTKVVWDAVFGESETTQRLADIDEFHSLIQLTREAVLKLQQVSNRQIYLNSLNELSRIVHQYGLIGGKWSNLHSCFSQPMFLDLLAATADIIDNETHLLFLTAEQQKDLLAAALGLLEEIASSDIDSALKVFLTIRLEEVCAAIRHYGISGSEGLRRVVESNLGSAMLQSSGFSKETTGQTIFEKFMKLMLRCGTLLSIAADVDGFLLPGATEIVKRLLPGK